MMTPLTTPFDMILEVLASAIRQEKATQGVHMSKFTKLYSVNYMQLFYIPFIPQ